MLYVNLIPVRARLCEQATAYEWSSARAHVRGRDRAGLIDVALWGEIDPLGDWEAPPATTERANEPGAQRLRAARTAG